MALRMYELYRKRRFLQEYTMQVIPAAFIRPYIGGEEYINGIRHFCLGLRGVESSVIPSLPEVKGGAITAVVFFPKSYVPCISVFSFCTVSVSEA